MPTRFYGLFRALFAAISTTIICLIGVFLFTRRSAASDVVPEIVMITLLAGILSIGASFVVIKHDALASKGVWIKTGTCLPLLCIVGIAALFSIFGADGDVLNFLGQFAGGIGLGFAFLGWLALPGALLGFLLWYSFTALSRRLAAKQRIGT
jgi:hypothetical protein